MMVKMTVQGGLIYLTLTLFAATVIARRGGWRAIGNAFWGTGFVAAVASVAFPYGAAGATDWIRRCRMRCWAC